MSRTIRELYELLGIKSIRTSVYHPQTDGLVEQFNRTLKTMIRKFVHEDAKNWDKWLELELGGIPVHTEYRCLFFLRYEFLKYRNTGVI